MKKRILASLLSLCLLVGMLPATALAAEDETSEGTAAVACTKTADCPAEEHTEDCPKYITSDEQAEGNPDSGNEFEGGIDDDAAVISPIQERINALPDVETLANMDVAKQAGVYAEVCAISDAIGELTDEEADALDTAKLEEAAAFFTQQTMLLGGEDTEISATNTYSGVMVDRATFADGIATIKVSYTESNMMAGIGYSYSLNGETVTGRAIAQQIDENGVPQTDKTNLTGFTRDCSVYTFEVLEGAENVAITVDGCTTWAYSNGTLTISGTGAMADFTYTTIDDSKENVNERGIMTFPWADHQQEITAVVVEDGITRLGNQSFRKFTKLTTLTVNSDDLTEIGQTLCMNDTALKTVDLTACINLQSIESGAFTFMSSETDITVKMTKMIPGLWQQGVNYTYGVVTFVYGDQSNLITTGDWKAVILSNGDELTCELTEYTGTGAEVEIPASLAAADGKTYTVVSLAAGLFQEKASITKISFEGNTAVTAIPPYFISIASNSALSSVVLPSSIQTIGTYAFMAYSNNLETFQIGKDSSCIDLTGLTEIGSLGLANLKTTKVSVSGKDLKVSASLKSIGANAFRNDTFNKMILTAGDYTDVAVADGAFTLFYLTNGLEMADGVENADAIIDGLLEVGKVKTFTQLYDDGKVVYTVDYAANTVSIKVDGVEDFESSTEWHGLPVVQTSTTIVGTLWTITATTSASGEKTCTITSYNPDENTDTKVTIPKEIEGYTVKAIGERVFYGNETVTEVTFAEDSECESIGDYAFAMAASNTPGALTSVTLPKSLKTIGREAFHNRSKIDTFPTLPEGLTTIGYGAFWNVSNAAAETLVIPASVTSIGGVAFRWCYKIGSVVVKSETLELGPQAFLLINVTSAYGKYIDLSAVKTLTLPEETNDTVTNGLATFRLSSSSVIYVANDEIAALMNDTTSYPYAYDRTRTSIVVVNGGTVAENLTGLSSVTRDDYTAVWYTDSGYTEKAENTEPLTAGTTYYAEWTKSIGESYTVSAISDQIYTGKEIKPTVVVKDTNGLKIDASSYTVEYSGELTNVTSDSAGEDQIPAVKVTLNNSDNSATVTFKIIKDENPSVLMKDVNVPYDGEAHAVTATAKTWKGNVITGEDIITIKYYTDAACEKEWTGTDGETQPTAAGTYYAKATLEETTNYAEATATATITITKATFEVSAEGYFDTYDGKAHSITVTADDDVTVTYCETENGDYTSTNPTYTNAGEYTVYYKATKANHKDVTGSVSVKITKATLTATYVSETINVGGTPKLDVTVAGFVNGETADNAADYKAPTVTNSNTAVGNYELKPAGGSAKNYQFAYVAGTLTIRSSGNGGGGGSSSGGSTTYTVTVDSGKNGTVTVSPKNASKGATVTITVKPNSGYELDGLTVTDTNGDTVGLTQKSDTQYTFTMPASKVTVEASFTKIAEQPSVTFIDVPASAYYYDAVAWAVENGVTSGTTATTFSPNAACTRAQTVTFLWRAAGSPAPKSGVNPFTDVQPGAYYYEAVLWAVENGITAGTTATAFSPDATVTRGQTVTFLHRAAGTAGTGSNPFTDVADSAYYAGAVQWALARGITSGTSATTFSPDDPCTRAQIVTFLYRAEA